MLEMNKLYCMDCMGGMAEFPDNYFDLAIVDPPYGGAVTPLLEGALKIGGGVLTNGCRESAAGFGGWFDGYKIERTGGTWADKYGANIKHWDIAPPPEYFNELARISKNQIIWGGNYFDLPPTRCFIIWRKLTISESFSMAMCEYAWTSFNGNAKWFECVPQGNNEKRFHPTQKPIELYKWILGNYAKDGDKILDTHAGSASSLIACYEGGYDFIGFEIDEYYHEMANERLESRMSQLNLFRGEI